MPKNVKELRGLGIQPNMLVIRTEKPAGQNIKNKLAQFCDVAPEDKIDGEFTIIRRGKKKYFMVNYQ